MDRVRTCAGNSRQRDTAAKLADETLRPSVFIVARAVLFALPADGQHPILQRELDVFLPHSGKLDNRDDIVVRLVEIERGRPTGEQLGLAHGVRDANGTAAREVLRNKLKNTNLRDRAFVRQFGNE